jgi:hypothetical protein
LCRVPRHVGVCPSGCLHNGVMWGQCPQPVCVCQWWCWGGAQWALPAGAARSGGQAAAGIAHDCMALVGDLRLAAARCVGQVHWRSPAAAGWLQRGCGNAGWQVCPCAVAGVCTLDSKVLVLLWCVHSSIGVGSSCRGVAGQAGAAWARAWGTGWQHTADTQKAGLGSAGLQASAQGCLHI